MTQPIVSKKRTQNICGALFFVGLGVVGFIGQWWPGVMLAIGIPLALRQFFLRKFYDVIITLIICFGIVIFSSYEMSTKVILPIMFIIAGIYIFFRDFIESQNTTEVEEEENLNEEIEEEQHLK
jgi:hypothetical protein